MDGGWYNRQSQQTTKNGATSTNRDNQEREGDRDLVQTSAADSDAKEKTVWESLEGNETVMGLMMRTRENNPLGANGSNRAPGGMQDGLTGSPSSPKMPLRSNALGPTKLQVIRQRETNLPPDCRYPGIRSASSGFVLGLCVDCEEGAGSLVDPESIVILRSQWHQ